MKVVNYHLRAAWFIARNSYREQNQSWVSFFTRSVQPIVVVSGYYLFYHYLLSDQQFSILLYYGYIMLVSLVDVPRFASYIQKDIQLEKYLMIDRLPIHPFLYYFWRNIGSSFTTFCCCFLIATYIFLTQHVSPFMLITTYVAAISSILLAHLLSFLVATIIFYTEQIHLWMFGMLFEFLGGKIIPYVALPIFLQTIMIWIIPFGFASGGIAYHLARHDTQSIFGGTMLSFVWSFFIYKVTKRVWDNGGFYFQEHG